MKEADTEGAGIMAVITAEGIMAMEDGTVRRLWLETPDYYYAAPYPVYPESYVVEVSPSVPPEPVAVQQVQQNVAPQSKQVPDAALNSSPMFPKNPSAIR